MRDWPMGWIMLGAILALIIAGSVLWGWLVPRIVLGAILALILAVGVFFAYICFRMKAYKWGAGCSAVVVLSLLGLWWDIFHFPF